MVKKGLGRGFDSLIPTEILDETFDPTSSEDAKVSTLQQMPLDQLEPDPEQPRRYFEESALQDLAESLRLHGVLQPLVAVRHGKKFRLIAGERRWRASKIAGLESVPVIIRTADAQEKLELALIENLQREDLNPLEEATAYLKLSQQFNIKYDEIGKRVGKAFSTISNILRLLHLPQNAKDALVQGLISEGHARQILAIDQLDVQTQLLTHIIKDGWSVRKSEQFVVGYKEGGQKNSTIATKRTKTESEETRQLAKRLGAPVQLKTMAKGGQLIIRYKTDAELAAIYNHLRTQ